MVRRFRDSKHGLMTWWSRSSRLQHLLHSTHPPHSTTHTHTPFSATGVVGLDNFNDYYPVSLKRARQLHAEAGGVHTVDGDINDVDLLGKLFAVCQFTHVVHMAAQVCVGRGWWWVGAAHDCDGRVWYGHVQ